MARAPQLAASTAQVYNAYVKPHAHWRNHGEKVITSSNSATGWPWTFDPKLGLRSFIDRLEQSQWYSTDQWEHQQRTMLLHLLRWAIDNSPYYAAYRLQMEQLNASSGNFWAIWKSMPVLTKIGLHKSGEALLSANLPRFQQPFGKIHTSGSTGTPVEVFFGRAIPMLHDAITLRNHHWQRRDFKKSYGFIRYQPREQRDIAGTTRPDWGHPVNQVKSTGPSAIIHTGLPVDTLADWLLDFDPAYLVAYPSVMQALVGEFEVRGTRPPSLEEVQFISEPVNPDTLQHLERDWNVAACDVYSCNELSYLALQCPDSGLMHVQSEAVFLEVVNERGDWCAPGETGKVLITSLHNFVMPLVRYELGDFATVGPPCSCGRKHPTLARIDGRQRNLAYSPEGKAFWPTGLGALRKVSVVQQAQYVQTALDKIDLRLVLERSLTDHEEQDVRALAELALGYPYQFNIVPVPALERTATGKFEEFSSQMDHAQ